jgi:hypothetical protein
MQKTVRPHDSFPNGRNDSPEFNCNSYVRNCIPTVHCLLQFVGNILHAIRRISELQYSSFYRHKVEDLLNKKVMTF